MTFAGGPARMSPYVRDMHEHPHVHDGDRSAFDSPAMAAFAELEGEVLEGLAIEAISAINDERAVPYLTDCTRRGGTRRGPVLAGRGARTTGSS